MSIVLVKSAFSLYITSTFTYFFRALNTIQIGKKQSLVLLCYGPSVISDTVTKGGHPSRSGLYGTSGTIGRGVSQVT